MAALVSLSLSNAKVHTFVKATALALRKYKFAINLSVWRKYSLVQHVASPFCV